MWSRPSLFYCLLTLIACTCTRSASAQDAPVVGLDPQKTISQYVHRYWMVEQGLPQNSVNAIARSRDGYLWLGTQEGLVRFDGLKFKVFDKSTSDAFSSKDVRVLVEDRQGVLWIGTRAGGLVRYEDGAFRSGNFDRALDEERITAIQLLHREEGLWVGTAEQGVWKLVGRRAVRVDGVPSGSITSLFEDREGTLWVGTRDSGLVRYRPGQVETYSTSTGFPANDITAITADDEGALWIGTREHGLIRMEGDRYAVYTTDDHLPSNNILALHVDPRGTLWAGTDQAGLVRLRFDRGASVLHRPDSARSIRPAVSRLTSAEGLPNDVVKIVYPDREGNLWIGTDGGGLNQLRDGKFTTYTVREGLADNFIFSVHEDAAGQMWFSSEKGVSTLVDGEIETFTTADGLANNFVPSLGSTPDSSVWLGTYGSGLNRYKDGIFTTYTKDDGLPDDGIFALYTDSKGRLWIGTGGGVAAFAADTFRTYTTDEGLSSDFVTVMLEDRESGLWVGTYNAGLNLIKGDKIIPFSSEEGLSNDAVLALHQDDEGVLWVGTYGGGLNRIEDGIVTTYTTKEGLFNDNVVQIIEDDSGYLWMSCNKGLFRVEKEELNALAKGTVDRVTSLVFDESDGLKSREFNGGVQPAGWKSRDGRLWFPSSKGVASIDPDHIAINEHPPRVVIEKVIVDGVETSLEGEVQLAAGSEKIEFHYVGLSYIAPEKTTYRYMLEGADREWSEAGERRTAYYTNLDPGHYTLHVIAKNGDGVASREAAQFSFYLRPYFYQTAWFFIVSGMVLVLSGYGLYKRRMANIRQHERELERLVEDRTRVLEKRTADLLQILEHNKEIMGITSHDLKNPLGGIIGLADMLLEDLGEVSDLPQVREGIENVVLLKSEAERMLRIIKDLLDKHREGEGTILRKECIDLLELARDVCRWNDQKAVNKNISITLSESGKKIVYGDPDALLRVIDNLVSNAVKYSPPGKRIWVAISELYEDVLVQVQDEGPGLTKGDMEKVFGKMQRLSAKPTAGEHSTGLGLYIVKQLIEEHGGEVGVNSVYGKGATFWFKLPLLNGETVEPAYSNDRVHAGI